MGSLRKSQAEWASLTKLPLTRALDALISLQVGPILSIQVINEVREKPVVDKAINRTVQCAILSSWS
jgi:hypothetical protein